MEVRIDLVWSRATIVSEARRKRPKISSSAHCPFCPGNEHLTPPGKALLLDGTILVEDESGGARDWLARIFPNKYPALAPRPPPAHPPARPAKGYHLVVVETPRHVIDPHEIPLEEYVRTLRFTLETALQLAQEHGIEWVLIFKNRGRQVGASIECTHMQIIALPQVSPIESVDGKGLEREMSIVHVYIVGTGGWDEGNQANERYGAYSLLGTKTTTPPYNSAKNTTK